MTQTALPPGFEVDPDCPSTRVHGTAHAYRKHNCRCPEAVFAVRKQKHDSRQRLCEAAGRPYRPLTWVPGEDVDDLAVANAIAGRRVVGLSTGERRAVVIALTSRGWSAHRIGEHMQMTSRSVVRHRRRAKELQS